MATPRKRGRHKKTGPKVNPIPLAALQAYAACQCTQAEVAAKFGVSPSTIEARLRKPAWRNAWERGRALGLFSLRAKQFRMAMDGNPTMLVWLGKQLLGQRDEQVLIPEPTEVAEEPLTADQWETEFGAAALAPTNGSATRPH